MKLAKRMGRLGTETAFEVLAKAKALEAQGKDIIHLEIGEPDFDTPKNIRQAAIEAIGSGWTHYTPACGIPQLRQAVADYISKTRGIKVDPNEVVAVPGGKPIIFFSILALVDEGDEVIYPNPGFPIYESVINFIGAKPIPIPLKEEKDFRLDTAELAGLITSKTKLIIINSPQNPTGGVLTEDDLAEIAELAKKHDLMLLSDEIYSEILYDDEKHHSITRVAGMKERTIILDGFSKTFAMTGWRLGYGVMPVELAEQITKLMINSNSCNAGFTQKAGAEGLTGPWDDVRSMVAEFAKRRDAIVEGLNEIPGISCRKPKGAFYVFPNIKETGKDSGFLEGYLLNEAGVAVLSGAAFGEYGEGYLRLSYANSLDNIDKAISRIDKAIRAL